MTNDDSSQDFVLSEELMARIDGEQGPRWVFMVSDGGEA